MNSSREVDVSIIGGGIIGISTAICLELAGFRTHIITSLLPFDIDSKRTNRLSEIASDFAAASIIPHSINIEHLQERMALSQKVFALLHKYEDRTGIGIRHHYELFEDGAREDPPYREIVMDYNRLPDDGSGEPDVPKQRGARKIWGWSFKALFASMNVYLKWLFFIYHKVGGRVEEKELSFKELVDREKVPGKVLINCTGYGSTKLFPEMYSGRGEVAHKIVRGHLVHFPFDCELLPKNKENLLVSYNYTATIHTNPEGTDIYFYPRRNDIVLGGSRQSGKVSKNGLWEGEEIKGSKIKIGNIEVPAALMKINHDLILQLTNGKVNINKLKSTGTRGYRFVTDRVRLERGKDLSNGRPVVHSVGYGGGGVTLSWGAASVVRQYVEEILGCREQRSLLDLMKEFFIKS